jgi:hypothetical protein
LVYFLSWWAVPCHPDIRGPQCQGRLNGHKEKLRKSPRLERYNAFPVLNIFGEAAPGRSSGEAMQAMEDIVQRLLKGIRFDWTGCEK